jgi:hypothetical protein
MGEWSNKGDPDDYAPRWLSRVLCRQGLKNTGYVEGENVAIEVIE